MRSRRRLPCHCHSTPRMEFCWHRHLQGFIRRNRAPIMGADGWSTPTVGREAGVFGTNGSNARWFAHTVIAPDRNAAVLVVTNSSNRAVVEEFINVMIQRSEAMPN